MRRFLTAMVVAVSLSAHFTTQAGATNDDGYRVPNGQNLRLSYIGTSPQAWINAMEWVRGIVLEPTDLTTFGSINRNPWDVKINAADYGNTNWAGQYQCAAGFQYGTVFVCTDGRVRLNNRLSKAPGGSWDDIEMRSLACEEMGHAIGLDHRNIGSNDGCMSQSWSQTGFTSHDISHINSWY